MRSLTPCLGGTASLSSHELALLVISASAPACPAGPLVPDQPALLAEARSASSASFCECTSRFKALLREPFLYNHTGELRLACSEAPLLATRPGQCCCAVRVSARGDMQRCMGLPARRTERVAFMLFHSLAGGEVGIFLDDGFYGTGDFRFYADNQPGEGRIMAGTQ